MATLQPEQFILGYNNADARIRASLRAFVEGMWLNAGSWRDDDIARLNNRIIPAVQGAQIQMANLTTGYVQALAQAIDGRTVRAVPVDRPDVLGGRGVDPDVVYQRPAVQMRTALSKGATVSDAIAQGANRLVSLVLTDVTLAKTHQERTSYSGSGYEYTIRTLTGRENCALCVIASTQRYNVVDLRPIHPGCDCGSRQVKAAGDPGLVIDQARLDEIHDAVAAAVGRSEMSAHVIDGLKTVQYANGVRGADYTDLIEVRQHGELGPLLTWRGQHFTGPDDLDQAA